MALTCQVGGLSVATTSGGRRVHMSGWDASTKTMPSTSFGYWAAYIRTYRPPNDCPTNT